MILRADLRPRTRYAVWGSVTFNLAAAGWLGSAGIAPSCPAGSFSCPTVGVPLWILATATVLALLPLLGLARWWLAPIGTVSQSLVLFGVIFLSLSGGLRWPFLLAILGGWTGLWGSGWAFDEARKKPPFTRMVGAATWIIASAAVIGYAVGLCLGSCPSAPYAGAGGVTSETVMGVLAAAVALALLTTVRPQLWAASATGSAVVLLIGFWTPGFLGLVWLLTLVGGVVMLWTSVDYRNFTKTKRPGLLDRRYLFGSG